MRKERAFPEPKDEIIIEVSEMGYWIFEDQKAKGRGFSPLMPADALANMIAVRLGLKRRFGESLKFKISKIEKTEGKK